MGLEEEMVTNEEKQAIYRRKKMNKFLTINGAGWCTVTFGDFTFSASYLTDVPFDCLKAAIKWLTDRTVFAVNFDGEGETCVVVSNLIV